MMGGKEILDTMSLDEFLIENKEATYLVKMKGDAMKEEGILSGDLLLVERGRTAKTGDIVLFVRNGEFGLMRLTAKNKKELDIEAVVRVVLRKY